MKRSSRSVSSVSTYYETVHVPHQRKNQTVQYVVKGINLHLTEKYVSNYYSHHQPDRSS